MNTLDPGRLWAPYPMPEARMPATLAEKLAAARTNSPSEALKMSQDVGEALRSARLSDNTCRAISGLLRLREEAAAQVCVTRRENFGKRSVPGNSAGVLFFDGATPGVVVSYPSRAMDGKRWIVYESGTLAAAARAIAGLHAELDATKV
jgi:hypothetical protein